MTEAKQPVFEPATNEFIGHYDYVRGYIRQQIFRHRLLPFLELPQSVLDYGGGAALDSIWATELGSQVDYWDDAEGMRSIAIQNISRANSPVQLLETDPVDKPTTKYSVLMLHVVLQYLPPESVDQLVPKLSKLIKSGGVLSLADRNWETIEGDSEIKHFQNNLNLNCWAYSWDSWKRRLKKLGFNTFSANGVRSLTESDKRLVKEVPRAELEDLVEKEKAFSARADSVKTGRLLHILAVKQ